MLRISRKTDYAIRVIVALAKKSEKEKLSAVQIQKETLIPASFLRRIIANLAQLDLVATVPGPNGGISLAKPADEISLLDLLQGMDGEINILDCLCKDGDCMLAENCAVRRRMGNVQNLMLQEFRKINFAQLAQEEQQGMDFLETR